MGRTGTGIQSPGPVRRRRRSSRGKVCSATIKAATSAVAPSTADTSAMTFKEYVDGELQATYSALPDKAEFQVVQKHQTFQSIRGFLVDAFLPEGYPDSVSRDYLQYQFWDTAQAFCSSITGTLSTYAVLKGIGVGDETATAAAATLTSQLQQFFGMTGSIIFTWYQGTDLDENAKQWRLVADVLNDIAFLVDLLSPAIPGMFVPCVCFSSLARAIVGVAGGATRAALTQHQARSNNMGDVSAKDGSQETIVNLVALFASITITPFIVDSWQRTWALFLTFICLHLFCNYRAVRSLQMDRLNAARADILFQEIVTGKSRGSKVLTPREVNAIEPVLSFHTPRDGSIVVGASMQTLRVCLEAFCKNRGSLDSSNGKQSSKKISFPLSRGLRIPYFIAVVDGIVQIGLEPSATEADIHEAFFAAVVVRSQGARTVEFELEKVVHDARKRYIDDILPEMKQKGWQISRGRLGASTYRLKFDNFSI